VNPQDSRFMTLIFEIRRGVFQQEQGVDQKIDEDGQDEHALQWLAFSPENLPVATARARILSPGQAKIERMAVLKPYRNSGAGQALLQAVLKDLKSRGVNQVILYAQTRAVSFYQKAGFKSFDEEFFQAGIAHLKMQKTL